ncbi:glycosyltransferase family 4 protein [Opitutus terrae]|uniref:Glycosyl transferase group 1 n=1 Tax=Opitutus terrae (strain DSM 11246 / JCM 15787 / PB90-1) TaxID=452637 RepID=B1ZP79_OPITP|nr:glycosyltransferase family 1 protein [Opitutus terrae]ACB77568.1 glycosyl transferase group 1 [Opitutus terrae PB90-1]
MAGSSQASRSWFSRVLQRVRPAAPITVGVDLMLMQPGGANGGVKPLVYSFLAEIARTHGRSFRYVVFAQPELAPEITAFLRPCDELVCATQPSTLNPQLPARRSLGEGGSTLNPPPNVASAKAGQPSTSHLSVLYAPFGRSPLIRPGLPTVSLIVDLLHRDLPEALPPEEVHYRHEWFQQLATSATFFQCISHYTASRLQLHNAVPPARCFVTHIPVHQRLATDAIGTAESPIAGPFFFYPANSWPHKNHEALLAAYQRYRSAASAEAWPLVLTGYPDARMQSLATHATSLGLGGHVHFLGHVDDAHFRALWRAAGALVYPSRHEGFGIPLLEAMSFRCPIIAANTTSLPEVGGDACLYVDPNDVASLASALTRIASDAALRAALVQRGTERLAEFSLSREAAKLADCLVRAAGRS